MVPLRSLAAPAAPSTGGTWDRRRQDWASAESSNHGSGESSITWVSQQPSIYFGDFPHVPVNFPMLFPIQPSMSSGDFLATLEDTFIAPALRSFLVFQDRFVRLNDHFMVISWWFHGDVMVISWYKHGNSRIMKTWRLGNPPTGWGIPPPVEGMCWWARQTLGRYLMWYHPGQNMVHMVHIWRLDPKEIWRFDWFNLN